MLPVQTLRNCRIGDAEVGDVFIDFSGEKFLIGTAGNGKVVAMMIDGDLGSHKPFYFAPAIEWNRRGLAIKATFAVDPSALVSSSKAEPGSLALDGGVTYVSGYSGQSYQPVSLSSKVGSLSDEVAAFNRWSATVEGLDGKPIELFSFAAA